MQARLTRQLELRLANSQTHAVDLRHFSGPFENVLNPSGFPSVSMLISILVWFVVYKSSSICSLPERFALALEHSRPIPPLTK
jgi:hypothetical protein